MIFFNRDTIEEFRRDPEIAIMYLESEIEEYHKTGDIKYLLRTLKRIIKAFGITNFSKKNNINRSTLNNVFNNKHKPGINTLNSILKPLGYEALTIFRRI